MSKRNNVAVCCACSMGGNTRWPTELEDQFDAWVVRSCSSWGGTKKACIALIETRKRVLLVCWDATCCSDMWSTACVSMGRTDGTMEEGRVEEEAEAEEEEVVCCWVTLCNA